MTLLALLKRKINFSRDKQISRVIICSHTDKEKDRLELSHAGIPHFQPLPSTATKEPPTRFGWDTRATVPGSLTLRRYPGSPCTQAARQGIGATLLFGFPQADRQSRRWQGLSSRVCHLRVLPAPGGNLSDFLNLSTELAQVPTSLEVVSDCCSL